MGLSSVIRAVHVGTEDVVSLGVIQSVHGLASNKILEEN